MLDRLWVLTGGVGLAAGALTVGFFLNAAHKAEIQALKSQHRMEIAEAMAAEAKARKAVEEKAEEVATDYEKATADLDRLRAAKRVQPSRCIPVDVPPACAAREHHDAAWAGPVAAHGGIDAAALWEYAGDAEQTRLQLIACQAFIKTVWAQNDPAVP